MKIAAHTYRRIVGAALALVALAVLCSAAAAARPAGVSPAEYRALLLRSQAMNVLYASSVPKGAAPETVRADRIRGEALNRLYGNAATRMTPNEFTAYYARGTWLNAHARPVATAEPPVAALPASGFDWGDAAIGAGFAVGLVLLGAAGAIALRRSGLLAHPHR